MNPLLWADPTSPILQPWPHIPAAHAQGVLHTQVWSRQRGECTDVIGAPVPPAVALD